MNEEESQSLRGVTLSPDARYGSTTSRTTSVYSDETEETGEDIGLVTSEYHRQASFHLGMSAMNAGNIWTGIRQTESFIEHGDEYEKVPSELVDNVKLVTDPNLDQEQKGALYYSEQAFYNPYQEPEYALTVHPDIYQRILCEVSDAVHTYPCGTYFCCHGGDGAHTGVSHDDYVDIRVAWGLLAVIFTFIMSGFMILP